MLKLDEIAVNIELVLISIIEGVALVTLGEYSIQALKSQEWLMLLPYVLSGLTILLVFWSQSILHAVSFIRWPIRIEHMLLYFVAALLQVIAYSNITDVGLWFFWWSLFSLFAFIMYIVDLRIIRQSHEQFAALPNGKKFIEEVERRHVFEMTFLVPLALLFNVGMCVAAYTFPLPFNDPEVLAIAGTLQLLISIGALVDCTRNFKSRSVMIASLSKKD